VLFLVPCRRFYPSLRVRVLDYLPRYRERGVACRIMAQEPALAHRLLGAVYDSNGELRGRAVRATLEVSSKWTWRLHRGWTLIRLLYAAPRHSLVYVQKALVPLPVLSVLRRRCRALVYDYDDAQFLRQPAESEGMMRAADLIVAGSHFLKEYAESHGARRVELVPSGVAVESFPLPAGAPASDVLRVGWLGSPSTVDSLGEVAGALRRLGQQRPVTLVVAGTGRRLDLLPPLGHVRVEVVPSYEHEEIPELVGRFDIGLMPLPDTPASRGKCALKLLIYMAGCVPAVSSSVGESLHIVKPGCNGFLASDAEAWYGALNTLAASPQLRSAIGRAGRSTVEERYSTQVCWDLLWRNALSPWLTRDPPPR
jgi:glycosyltransferase involved in cell wall biosynthesis